MIATSEIGGLKIQKHLMQLTTYLVRCFLRFDSAKEFNAFHANPSMYIRVKEN
jgi:hypothetical protein